MQTDKAKIIHKNKGSPDSHFMTQPDTKDISLQKVMSRTMREERSVDQEQNKHLQKSKIIMKSHLMADTQNGPYELLLNKHSVFLGRQISNIAYISLENDTKDQFDKSAGNRPLPKFQAQPPRCQFNLKQIRRNRIKQEKNVKRNIREQVSDKEERMNYRKIHRVGPMETPREDSLIAYLQSS